MSTNTVVSLTAYNHLILAAVKRYISAGRKVNEIILCMFHFPDLRILTIGQEGAGHFHPLTQAVQIVGFQLIFRAVTDKSVSCYGAGHVSIGVALILCSQKLSTHDRGNQDS